MHIKKYHKFFFFKTSCIYLLYFRKLSNGSRCLVQHVQGAEKEQNQDSGGDGQELDDSAQLHPRQGISIFFNIFNVDVLHLH